MRDENIIKCEQNKADLKKGRRGRKNEEMVEEGRMDKRKRKEEWINGRGRKNG